MARCLGHKDAEVLKPKPAASVERRDGGKQREGRRGARVQAGWRVLKPKNRSVG